MGHLPNRLMGLQRRSYSYAVQLLVLACLGAALYVSMAALLAKRSDAVLGPNADPVAARDYGFPAVRR